MKAAALLLGLGLIAAAQDDLPKQTEQGPLEFEPELQLYDVKPEPGGPTEPWAIPADVNKARTDADRAQRKAKRWQQLQKSGVLSKVEAERAVLQANRAVYRYQQALVVDAQKQVDALRARVAKGEASSDLLLTAEESLQTTSSLAAEAEALLKRTDLEFAQNQLERQRKLHAAGLTSKRQVERAQSTLEKTKAESASPPTTPKP